MDQYDKKYYQAGNFDRVLRHNSDIDENDVVVEVDGDDYLPDENVLHRINELYSDKDVWIANGSFKYLSGEPGFSSPQKDFSNLRNNRFTASHIRTWRVFLWRSILEEDLKDDDGNYWRWSGDLCFMYPMLEMATEEHYRFMPDINYVYNNLNPINEHKVDISMVNDHANRIRSKPKYNKLIR